MLIGFYISNLNGFRKEAIDFIVKYCYGYDTERATNIVDRTILGWRTNIWSETLSSATLAALPFTCVEIHTNDDITLVSLIDHKLELPFVNTLGTMSTKIVLPTEYFVINRTLYSQFKKWVDIKWLREYSSLPLEPDLQMDDFTPVDFATQDLL